MSTYFLPTSHSERDAILLLQVARNQQSSDTVACFLGDAILYLWDRSIPILQNRRATLEAEATWQE